MATKRMMAAFVMVSLISVAFAGCAEEEEESSEFGAGGDLEGEGGVVSEDGTVAGGGEVEGEGAFERGE